jgi:hypothetical protein
MSIDEDWEIPYEEVPWDTPPSSPVQSPRELKELAIAVQKALQVASPKEVAQTISIAVLKPPPAKRNRRVHGGL